MELRRCTRGTGLLALLLLALAAILDEPAIFFAGSAILAGIVVAGLRFDRRCRAVVRSVSVFRSPERTRVRTGNAVGVATDITIRAPTGIAVEGAEIFPAGVAVQDGIPSFSQAGTGAEEKHRLRYRILPLVHGTLPVRGISLGIRDNLFATTFALTADRYSGPPLQVLPQGAFVPAGSHSSMETREIEKMSALRGYGIRGLREYYAGDSLRNIDWKLSAKHDKLFIREYTGLTNLPPVLVADLPWSGLPYTLPEFERMVQLVAGRAEHAVRNNQYFTLILVSGPNILQVIEEERDLQHGMTLLREWLHPSERLVHWYRVPGRSALRNRIGMLDQRMQEKTAGSHTSFFAALKEEYQEVLPCQRQTAFSTDLVRVLSHFGSDTMVIFSLCAGDSSHIREIIRQAKMMKFSVHLRSPAAAVPSFSPSGRGETIPDSVEAFA